MAGRADIAHVSRTGTAASASRWREIAQTEEFRRLETMRRRTVGALLGLFTVVFVAFLILCAYARPFMRRSVDGGLTVAYVWLLGLTVLAWILAWSDLRFSERTLEPLAEEIAERARAAHNGDGR